VSEHVDRRLNSALLTAKIPHRTEIREDAKFTLDIIATVRKQQAQMLEEFRAMAQRRVVEAEVRAILEAAYPDPKPTRKQMVSHIVVNDTALVSAVNDNRTVAEALLRKIQTGASELQARQEKIDALRGLALERLDILKQEHTAIGDTVWGTYQAVTEVENWRGDGGKGTANSVLWGERAAEHGAGIRRLPDPHQELTRERGEGGYNSLTPLSGFMKSEGEYNDRSPVC
jgi:hypothetical protein